MSETGNAKNVANFEAAVMSLIALGAGYNPSQPLILIPALQAKLAGAKTALASVNETNSAESVAVRNRAAAFANIGKLATKIGGAAAVSVNNEAFNHSIQTVVRKIQGRRAGDAPADNPATPDIDESKAISSVSQQSYDNLAANFAALVALLKTELAYHPNEPEMKIAALETYQTAMQTANNAAKIAAINADNARVARDQILYDEDAGILNLVRLIKKYANYVFGRDSAIYQQLAALIFKEVK